MTTKKTRASSSGKSAALATIKSNALTPTAETRLSSFAGSGRVLEKLPGTGGEVAAEDGVMRITGRDYATSSGTVPAAEIFFVMGSKPREDGPWLGEADKLSWIDPATGFECILMRENPDGFLSGYVGVPVSHPLFGWEHEAVTVDIGIDVHGGLTYSQICQDGPSPQRSLSREARRICHVIVGHAPLQHASAHRAGEGHWWFGFSCDQVYDIVPGRQRDRPRFMAAETSAEYRDDAYVVREILILAAQLKAIEDGQPVPAREGPPLPAIGLDPQKAG